jgi:mRNA-degrading endonuclease RelE of RelBE toxin-antitoxin system
MRKVIISKEVLKDISQFDGREKQWICAVIRYLENEDHSIQTIKQKFATLRDDLKGYYKAKHRGFKIRCVFKILSEREIALYVEKTQSDPLIDEILQLIAVGKRDSIYELARKRVNREDND